MSAHSLPAVDHWLALTQNILTVEQHYVHPGTMRLHGSFYALSARYWQVHQEGGSLATEIKAFLLSLPGMDEAMFVSPGHYLGHPGALEAQDWLEHTLIPIGIQQYRRSLNQPLAA